MMSTAFTGKNAFVDCLCASAELQHKTTFWRRAEDVILRPLKVTFSSAQRLFTFSWQDHGQPDNKQRQVLADAKVRHAHFYQRWKRRVLSVRIRVRQDQDLRADQGAFRLFVAAFAKLTFFGVVLLL